MEGVTLLSTIVAGLILVALVIITVVAIKHYQTADEAAIIITIYVGIFGAIIGSTINNPAKADK